MDHVCAGIRFFTGLALSKSQVGWRVGKQACYTWVFSTMLHVLFRCGVSRSKSEAQAILGEKFEGIGVTDDYRAYESLFIQHQLCWAHLLRKSIKLMLQYPNELCYREFFEKLYAIYQQGVRWQKDQRLSVGRPQKGVKLNLGHSGEVLL
jgi:transposase